MARINRAVTKIDKHIGKKIHELRIAQGLTREQLSKVIYVSNQQLQKYETGVNRICAGRLLLIARALGQEVHYFYEGVDSTEYKPLIDSNQRLNLEMSKNFMKITSVKQRQVVNSLIKSLINAA